MQKVTHTLQRAGPRRDDGYIAKPDDGDRKNKSLDNVIVNTQAFFEK